MTILVSIKSIGILVAVAVSFAGGLQLGSLRLTAPRLPCFSRPKTSDDLLPAKIAEDSVSDRAPDEFEQIPDSLKMFLLELSDSLEPSHDIDPPIYVFDKTRVVFETLIAAKTEPEPVWPRVRDAIDAIADDPARTFDLIRPLHDLADVDLGPVLRNLRVLHRAVVVYDLVRLVEHRLASVLRRYRYTIRFAELRRMHAEFEPLAISRAYESVLRLGNDCVENRFRQSVKERMFDEMGLDRERCYTTTLFDEALGEWEQVQIPIDAIVGNAICDIDFRHVRNRDEKQQSLNVRALNLEFGESHFDAEISEIGNRMLKMIQAARPTETKFLSLYEVANPREHYSTSHLHALLDAVHDAAFPNPLDFINLVVESGLYREYDRLSEQSAARRRLLDDLLAEQRALTISRSRDESFDLFSHGIKYAIKTDLLSSRGRQIYELARVLIEYAVEKFLEGAGSELLFRGIGGISVWALPALRFDSRQERWEPIFLPLEEIVDFALETALRYWPDLTAGQDPAGTTLFSYQSDVRSGRDLVQYAFVQHFDHTLLTLFCLHQ